MTRIIAVLQVLALALFASVHAQSQETRSPIIIGEGIRQPSDIMGEDRVVIIGTPQGYERTDQRYPVLYLLDGGLHYQHTTAITQFLGANLYMPQMIVVAINSPDRVRDLTPKSSDPDEIERYPTHGGFETFQRYLKEELIPWVEGNYRTHPYRILIGHSFGGLFAVQSLIAEPGLFDAYVAISPSMHWDTQALVAGAENFLERTETLPATFYMSAGNEGRESLGGMRKLAAMFDEKSPQGFVWTFEHMPLESHGSISLKSIYNGLEFVFQDWSLRNPYEIYKKFGVDAIEIFHINGQERYGIERSLPITTFATLLGDAIYRNNLDGAIEIMDRFYTSVNPPVSYVEFLANALRDKGRREAATRYYREILSREPNNQNAKQTLMDWGEDL